MNFLFLPKYLPYFNYGALVMVLISVLVVFWDNFRDSLGFAQRSKMKALSLACQCLYLIFRRTPMMVQIMIAFALMSINAGQFRLEFWGS